MSSSADGDGRSTRKRGRRGKPRKQTSIDDVTCEDPLYLPGGASALDGQISTNSGSSPNNATNNIGGVNAAVPAGDGCYVSALIQNRRYHGVLFDQSSLMAASGQYFQNEAHSLELNRRMSVLLDTHRKQEESQSNGQKLKDATAEAAQSNNDDNNDSSHGNLEPQVKKQKISAEASTSASNDERTVEKLRLVTESEAGQYYREVVATYINVAAAAEDDNEMALNIQDACQTGGGWVGKYYYQYQSSGGVMNAVASNKSAHKNERSYRLSMGMDTFLRNASLPPWYPLATIENQSKIMTMLKIKPDRKGGITASTAVTGMTAMVPMEPRSCFRVGIVGGGIAGLACAHELLRLSKRGGEQELKLQVVLLEARSRVGGRLNTDYDSFKSSDGSNAVPVDLGASWIHGITDNPLTALSQEAGVDLITSIEDVKMLGSGMKEVDRKMDKSMGDLFDALLDQGAADCWKREEDASTAKASQKACRWYGSVLGKEDGMVGSNGNATTNNSTKFPPQTPPSIHRKSLDISIDCAIGSSLRRRDEFERLSDQEHSLLRWYCENAQYALGSDLKDLSMMFWDSDETHAFEGDHVLLKQGYSSLAEHLLSKCEKYDSFKLVKNFPVGRLEFARNSVSHPYQEQVGSSIARIDLSDTCSVTSHDGRTSYNFDFVVSAVPLGVLKDSADSSLSVSSSSVSKASNRLTFEPPLPYSKRDAINNVGFGLLNKVYLQFPTAFWRRPGDRHTLQGTPFLGKGSESFGNTSGLNPQHYMFLDVGRTLNRDEEDPPAILMTLISGSEAVAAEQLSDEALTRDVLSTLRHLYCNVEVPEPMKVKITRWGSDEFSRGCYTFLPPGTSDQDYHILQSPVNDKGEAFMLDKSETMRLFFCGEHTTSLHPSMAHGAYLSGLRAAVDVLESTKIAAGKANETEEKSMPITMYRQKLPRAPLQCNLCNLPGNRKREGALLAFQRGGRKVLVHSNCAASSPEVSLHKGSWENVVKAVSRGKKLACESCGKNGATIGCTFGTDACLLSYHFRCAEDTGWDFERDGKAFLCDEHRRHASNWQKLRQTSTAHYIQKNPYNAVVCSLCGEGGDGEMSNCGDLLAFRRAGESIISHSNCLRYTNIVNTVAIDPLAGDDSDSDYEQGEDASDHGEDEQYQNVFEAYKSARVCSGCGRYGATIQCSENGCPRHFHFSCAEDTGWSFDIRRHRFTCDRHSNVPAEMNGAGASSSANESSNTVPAEKPGDIPQAPASNGSTTTANVAITDSDPPVGMSRQTTPVKLPAFLQHDLFCKGAVKVGNGNSSSSSHRSRKRDYKPSNEYVFHAARDADSPSNNSPTEAEEEQKDENPSTKRREETASSVYETVLTQRLTLDPHLIDTTRFCHWCQTKTIVKREAPSVPWGLQLGIVEHKQVERSVDIDGDNSSMPPQQIRVLEVTQRLNRRSYGLEPGDVITAINEMKIGSDDLADFVAVAAVMRTSLELRFEVLRRKCVEEVETVPTPPG